MKLAKFLVSTAGTLVTAAAFTLNVNAQPHWDNAFQLNGASNEQPGGYGGKPCPMVTTNGVVYALLLNDQGSHLMTWSKIGGWHKIANGDGIATLYLNGDYLYVGGYFNEISPTPTPLTPPNTDPAPILATNIARYNVHTGTWSAIGDGTLTSLVRAIVVDAQQRIYVGLEMDDVPYNTYPSQL